MEVLHSKLALRSTFALCLLVILTVFALTLHDALRLPGTDLRSRVVGARLMLAQLDPYPDPNVPQPNPSLRLFNVNTGSPALLAVYACFARLSYSAQRLLYFVLDWSFIALLFILTRRWFASSAKTTHITLFTLFVIADFGLRLQIGQGQYYTGVAGLTTVAINSFRQSERRSQWTGALALAALLLIRPTFFFVLPILWIIPDLRPGARRSIVAAMVLLLTTLLTFGLQPWSSYLRTIRRLQHNEIQAIFEVQPPIPSQAKSESSATSGIFSPTYGLVEGHNFSDKFHSNYAISRSTIGLCSIQQTVRPYCSLLFHSPSIFSWANTALLSGAFLYCIFLGRLLRDNTVDVQLALAFLVPTLLETFGPPRYAYSDITLAPVLLLISSSLMRPQMKPSRSVGVIAALAIAISVLAAVGPYLLSPAHKPILALSLLRWIALMFFVNVFLIELALCPNSYDPTISLWSASMRK